MKSIILHIEYLLQHADSVILPGIGAIIAEYEGATIDFEKGIIRPPHRHFSLNTNLSNDDGALAYSIARAENIPLEEAKAILAREITLITENLLRERKFTLGKVGNMIVNDNGQLQLLPRLNERSMELASGLQCVRMAEMPSDFEDKQSQHSVTDEAEEHANQVITHTKSAEIPEGSYLKLLSNKNYYIPVNKIFARCAAAVIVIVAIALSFIVPSVPSGNTPEVKASLNPVESLTSKPAEAHLKEKVKGMGSEDNISDTQKKTNPNREADDEESELIVSPTGCYLIVATFAHRNEAERYIESVGNTPFRLQAVEKNGVWRVSAGHGDTATLLAVLNSYEFKDSFKEAWIWNSEK